VSVREAACETEGRLVNKEPRLARGRRAGLAGSHGEVGQQGGPGRASGAGGPGARKEGATAPAAPCVLLADDDDQIRAVFGRCLLGAGFRVLEASSGEEALELSRRCGDGIDVLVTDVEMPGMGGAELAARIDAETPGLPVIYVTGNPGSISAVSLDNGALVLLKPLDLDDLQEAVERALEGRGEERTKPRPEG
jgi:CheY-like chemotaxis protein